MWHHNKLEVTNLWLRDVYIHFGSVKIVFWHENQEKAWARDKYRSLDQENKRNKDWFAFWFSFMYKLTTDYYEVIMRKKKKFIIIVM